MRALVLAAGRGERLRPLTDQIPKPLLPVLGKPILERTLERLAAAGVEAAAVNLHHLGEQIPQRLGDEVAGMPIIYSPEEILLGTLGPLARMREFLAGSDPVLLVNGDSLCDWPVTEILEAHRLSGSEATLLLSAAADPDRFGGGVAVDERGAVISFRGGREGAARAVFAGLHAISPTLLERLAERPADIVRDLYEPALERGATISTLLTEASWHDLGTPRRYLEGALDAAGDEGWTHPEAEIAAGARVESSVIERTALVEDEASVKGSLVLPGARVGAGASVEDSIVGPGVRVFRRSTHWSALLTGSDASDSIAAAGF